MRATYPAHTVRSDPPVRGAQGWRLVIHGAGDTMCETVTRVKRALALGMIIVVTNTFG